MILHAIDWDPLIWRVLAINSTGLLILTALLIIDRRGED